MALGSKIQWQAMALGSKIQWQKLWL